MVLSIILLINGICTNSINFRDRHPYRLSIVGPIPSICRFSIVIICGIHYTKFTINGLNISDFLMCQYLANIILYFAKYLINYCVTYSMKVAVTVQFRSIVCHVSQSHLMKRNLVHVTDHKAIWQMGWMSQSLKYSNFACSRAQSDEILQLLQPSRQRWQQENFVRHVTVT